MGVSVKSPLRQHHPTLRENSLLVKANPLYKYDPKTGYFGEHRKGTRIDVRLVYVNSNHKQEARILFNQLVRGAPEIAEDKSGKMWYANLQDGSKITLRIDHPDPSHAPAVMISVKKSNDSAGIVDQKIHFVKKGEDRI